LYCAGFYGEDFLAPRPSPKLEEHPWLFKTAYSAYSQLLSKSGVHTIHELMICRAVVTRDPLEINGQIIDRKWECSLAVRELSCRLQEGVGFSQVCRCV
jgi:hypothetical protein